MSDTPMTDKVAKTEKSVTAAFLLTFLFGPLGLLYATISGGIFLILVAIIVGFATFGLGTLVTWPVAMIWGVLAALASKRNPSAPA